MKYFVFMLLLFSSCICTLQTETNYETKNTEHCESHEKEPFTEKNHIYASTYRSLEKL